MPINDKQSRSIALDLVKTFDPDAVGAFDEVWEEYQAGSEADGMGEAKHGFGGAVPPEAWSLIIIPLIQALGKELVKLSVDAIVAWIRKRRGGVATPEDGAVAARVVSKVTAAESDVQPGPDAGSTTRN